VTVGSGPVEAVSNPNPIEDHTVVVVFIIGIQRQEEAHKGDKIEV
jgi:hypothetical protein